MHIEISRKTTKKRTPKKSKNDNAVTKELKWSERPRAVVAAEASAGVGSCHLWPAEALREGARGSNPAGEPCAATSFTSRRLTWVLTVKIEENSPHPLGRGRGESHHSEIYAEHSVRFSKVCPQEEPFYKSLTDLGGRGREKPNSNSVLASHPASPQGGGRTEKHFWRWHRLTH